MNTDMLVWTVLYVILLLGSIDGLVASLNLVVSNRSTVIKYIVGPITVIIMLIGVSVSLYGVYYGLLHI